jgi:hypothetical protein
MWFAHKTAARVKAMERKMLEDHQLAIRRQKERAAMARMAGKYRPVVTGSRTLLHNDITQQTVVQAGPTVNLRMPGTIALPAFTQEYKVLARVINEHGRNLPESRDVTSNGTSEVAMGSTDHDVLSLWRADEMPTAYEAIKLYLTEMPDEEFTKLCLFENDDIIDQTGDEQMEDIDMDDIY